MRDCLHLEGWDMKIVVVSDIQSNLAAISALPEESYEQLWCLGDIVGYGPRLHDAVRWVRSQAVFYGNHNYSVRFTVTPGCSITWLSLAAITRRYTQTTCTREDVEFLRVLPLRKEVTMYGHRAPTHWKVS